MEAKDTVIDMHNPQIMPEIYYKQQELLTRQAEISFRAGYEQVWKDGVIQEVFNRGKKVGIKEVVEWVEEHRWKSVFLTGDVLLGVEEWQAKLKEWGIK